MKQAKRALGFVLDTKHRDIFLAEGATGQSGQALLAWKAQDPEFPYAVLIGDGKTVNLWGARDTDTLIAALHTAFGAMGSVDTQWRVVVEDDVVFYQVRGELLRHAQVGGSA